MSDYFNNASLQDLKRGYVLSEDKSEMICLICGKKYEKDVIYSNNDKLVLGQKAIGQHILSDHGSVFDFLAKLEKKHTGISESQKDMLLRFYSHKNDSEIAKDLKVSKSTVRNYRFRLKEKAKQAKVFLAMMELLESRVEADDKLVDYHKEATMIDDRYVITEAEYKQTIERYIDKQGKITTLPRKQKRKLIILKYIINKFDINKQYTEIEVNNILKEFHDDHVSLRRYLIEYQFLKRKDDGSLYWRSM